MTAPKQHVSEHGEPLVEPPFTLVDDPAAEAGCAEFESTLLLMDGLLDGAPREKAAAHAKACETCAPLVEGWPALHDTLVARFDDAAERAKPDFVTLTDAVLDRVAPAKAAPEPTSAFDWFWQTIRQFQPHLAFGAAAAAIVLAVLPLAKDRQDPKPGTDPVAVKDPTPGPVDPGTAAEAPDRPVVVLRGVQFENHAEGMVYRTPRGGMTVLWVAEPEDV